jgi:hypothetical protein
MNGAGWTHCLGAPHLQRRVVAVDVRVDQLWDDVLPQVPQEALSPELRVHLLHPLRHLGRLSLVEESPDSRRDGAHRRHEGILRVLVRSRHGGEEVGDGLGCHGGQSRRLDNVGRRVELYCLSRTAIDTVVSTIYLSRTTRNAHSRLISVLTFLAPNPPAFPALMSLASLLLRLSSFSTYPPCCTLLAASSSASVISAATAL